MALILASAIVSGCVSHTVQPVTGLNDVNEICIVRNHRVTGAFFEAYQSTLEKVGFATRDVATSDGCETYTSYSANYGFHWGMYLSRAELNVYSGETLVGSATYKAPRADLSKHGRVEDKVQKLVDEMFSARNKNQL